MWQQHASWRVACAQMTAGPHAAFKEYLVDAATANMGGPSPLPSDYLPERIPHNSDNYVLQVAEYLEVCGTIHAQAALVQ